MKARPPEVNEKRTAEKRERLVAPTERSVLAQRAVWRSLWARRVEQTAQREQAAQRQFLSWTASAVLPVLLGAVSVLLLWVSVVWLVRLPACWSGEVEETLTRTKPFSFFSFQGQAVERRFVVERPGQPCRLTVRFHSREKVRVVGVSFLEPVWNKENKVLRRFGVGAGFSLLPVFRAFQERSSTEQKLETCWLLWPSAERLNVQFFSLPAERVGKAAEACRVDLKRKAFQKDSTKAALSSGAHVCSETGILQTACLTTAGRATSSTASPAVNFSPAANSSTTARSTTASETEFETVFEKAELRPDVLATTAGRSRATSRLIGPYLHRPLLLCRQFGSPSGAATPEGRELQKTRKRFSGTLPSCSNATEPSQKENRRAETVVSQDHRQTVEHAQVVEQLQSAEHFQAAAEHLVEYLRACGFNSLLLNVSADGFTLYPSRFWPNVLGQPLGDVSEAGKVSGAGKGRTAAGQEKSAGAGGSVLPPDVLELLFCEFDRAGLVLVPHLRFVQPLPASAWPSGKEAEADKVELVGKDGRTWRQVHEGAGEGAFYNPLAPAVQQAVLGAVRELVQRYGHHRSFQALSIELGNGYLLWPGLNWGYDDRTVRWFEQDTGIQVPSDENGGPAVQTRLSTVAVSRPSRSVSASVQPSPSGSSSRRFQRRFAFLSQEVRQQWIQWRCRRLAEFHKRIVREVTQVKPSCLCLFTCNRLLRSPVVDRDVHRLLQTGNRLSQLLEERGLSLSLYADTPQVVFLRPWVERAFCSFLEQSVDFTLNNDPVLTSLFTKTANGAFFYHVPVELPLTPDSLPTPSRFTSTLLLQTWPAGRLNRRRFAHALASGDARFLFDGGWLVQSGQETLLQKFVQTFQALPALPFRLCEHQHQPAVVRVAKDAQATYLYVVNDFPTSAEVRLTLSCARTVHLKPLGASREAALEWLQTHERRLLLRLQPYELWACRLNSPAVFVSDVHTDLPPAAWKKLKHLLASADQRLDQATQQTPQDLPFKNPGFELTESPTDLTSVTADWKILPAETLKALELEAEAGSTNTPAVYYTTPDQPADVTPSSANHFTPNSSKTHKPKPRELAQISRCQVVDKNVHSGRSCLLLHSSGTPVCLESRSFETAGFSCVSFSFWACSNVEHTPLRLELVGWADGHRFHRQGFVTLTKQWRCYVFRANDLPRSAEDVHIRLFLSRPARVRLDDLELQLQQFSPSDLRQFCKYLSAAHLAWDEQRYCDCVRLLNSFWICRLFERTKPARTATN